MADVKSILLVGVGGQGAILTAKVLVNGLMRAGYDVKMSEVHGMSQRGGSVSTQVRWGEKVYSPLIGDGAADYMVAFEKMEAVRYANFLKPDGVAIINDYAIASATIAAGQFDYPEGCLEAMRDSFKVFSLKAGEIAQELGSAKCMNIVLFGALTHVLNLEQIDWESVIRDTVPPKFLDLNLRAYRAGLEAAKKQ
ncbi:MAG: indolepyruvate oxidoreductase subunit beta [Faecousia sp.]